MSNANRVGTEWADRQGDEAAEAQDTQRAGGPRQTDRQLNWQMVVKHTKPTKRIEDGDRIEPLCVSPASAHSHKHTHTKRV